MDERTEYQLSVILGAVIGAMIRLDVRPHKVREHCETAILAAQMAVRNSPSDAFAAAFKAELARVGLLPDDVKEG